MRSKTRSFPSLSLSPDSFLRSPYLIWQRKWTNKSEVERETLSPSPERIATRDSLSPLSLFSFKQRLTHGGLGFRILPYVKMFLRLPSFLSLCRHWRHFVHPIDCDVTLVLARTTAALTNITSSSGAPRRRRDGAGDDVLPNCADGFATHVAGRGMRRQIKKSQSSFWRQVSVGNRKYNEDTHYNYKIRRVGVNLISQLTSERRGVKTAFSTAWKTGNISLTISTLGDRCFLHSVPASEPSAFALSLSLPERSDRPDDIDVSHGNFTWLSQHVQLAPPAAPEDATTTKCTALQELPSEAPPKGNAWTTYYGDLGDVQTKNDFNLIVKHSQCDRRYFVSETSVNISRSSRTRNKGFSFPPVRGPAPSVLSPFEGSSFAPFLVVPRIDLKLCK